MKKITIASVRKPLNLLLSYEISISRFVEMLNEEIGFDISLSRFDEILNEINDEDGFESVIEIENKEINENIIYVENTALNISLLDKFGYSNNFRYYYYYEKSDFIIINLDTKEYTTFNPADDNTKNTITSDSLFNIISK